MDQVANDRLGKSESRVMTVSAGNGHDRWEMVRRRRLRDLRRVLRDRYGPTLPDDDAGREDLRLLLLHITAGPNAALKMRRAIDVWAPQMRPDAAQELIDEINRIPIRSRQPTAREISKSQQLMNHDRERLKVWTIAPCDMSPSQMAKWRKAKATARRRGKRQGRGAKPRQQWLADNSISRTKPWKLAGFECRRTWERHGKPAPPNGVAGLSRAKFFCTEDRPATPEQARPPQELAVCHPGKASNGKAATKSKKGRTRLST